MSGVYSIRIAVDHRPVGDLLAQSPNLADVIDLWRPGVFLVCWHAEHQPIRRLSPDALARRRALAHNRRVERDIPLFAALYSVPVPPKPARTP